MLSSNALWLTQVASLEDRFEGSYPVPTAERIRAIEQTVERIELPADVSSAYVPEYSERSLARLRQRVYVNCWYAGLNESAALWQWAERKGQSVAIRTTYELLRAAIHGMTETYSGRVRYLNYQRDPVPFSHKLGVFFCKRKSFQHEQEVRVVVQRRPESSAASSGIALPVDLSALVKGVVVAPRAGDWYLSVVKTTLLRFGYSHLANCVRKSELDKDPIY
ncbi:MAG TPA: hypothetical protein VGR71_12865 [Nitrospira sp.]|nr:hypothetical protein [Nitrospira sp.]